MSYFIAGLLIVAGIIHILPLSGVIGAAHLGSLYGVQIEDKNLVILMRHRAVLFALLGALLVLCAVRPQFQNLAIVSGLVSTISFLGIALPVGDFNDNLTVVIVADLVALACLVVAAVVKFYLPHA